VLIGPVEATKPERKPMPAPTMASCHASMRKPRANSQRRIGIINRNRRPRMPSTMRASSSNNVRAPSAAIGMAVTQ
jgi:hypothetical protein